MCLKAVSHRAGKPLYKYWASRVFLAADLHGEGWHQGCAFSRCSARKMGFLYQRGGHEGCARIWHTPQATSVSETLWPALSRIHQDKYLRALWASSGVLEGVNCLQHSHIADPERLWPRNLQTVHRNLQIVHQNLQSSKSLYRSPEACRQVCTITF